MELFDQLLDSIRSDGDMRRKAARTLTDRLRRRADDLASAMDDAGAVGKDYGVRVKRLPDEALDLSLEIYPERIAYYEHEKSRNQSKAVVLVVDKVKYDWNVEVSRERLFALTQRPIHYKKTWAVFQYRLDQNADEGDKPNFHKETSNPSYRTRSKLEKSPREWLVADARERLGERTSKYRLSRVVRCRSSRKSDYDVYSVRFLTRNLSVPSIPRERAVEIAANFSVVPETFSEIVEAEYIETREAAAAVAPAGE